MDNPGVRKDVMRALVSHTAENEGSEPDTKNIELMKEYVSAGLEGIRKFLGEQ